MGDEQPYEVLGLREQLFLEARAMAGYALANGLRVSVETIKTLESFEGKDKAASGKPEVNTQCPVDNLVRAHASLARLVEPAKPSTILLFEDEKRCENPLMLLGPVPLIRQMMMVAILSLLCFIVLALSHYVTANGGNILTSGGLPLLLNLLFFLSAAGLGASFAALYKANIYISNGTFDPTHHSSYWIRFFLGLIAGLMLAVLISKNAFSSREATTLIEPGIIHPLLAMLGGFSANLLYTILNRLVETLESLFQGGTKSLLASRIQEEKSRLASTQLQQQSKVVVELLKLRQSISDSNDPAESQQVINRMLNDLLPDSEFLSESKGKGQG